MPNIDFAQVFLFFLVLVFSLTVHEAAHAWTADRLGDPTARLLGRVSLNPAVHIDPIGTIVFPLIAIVTNLPIIGWAKPVPVDIRKLRDNWRQKFMAIAAAGPASNLVIATVAAILLRVLQPGGPEPNSAFEIGTLLENTVSMNVLLAVFNMVPVPPLDGGNVLSGLLRGQRRQHVRAHPPVRVPDPLRAHVHRYALHDHRAAGTISLSWLLYSGWSWESSERGEPRVVSGMRPTGRLHLGHLVGALRNWTALQEQYDCFYFVADWHALTSEYANTSAITGHALDNVADWIAAGVDPERSTIFIQSLVPEHAEL